MMAQIKSMNFDKDTRIFKMLQGLDDAAIRSIITGQDLPEDTYGTLSEDIKSFISSFATLVFDPYATGDIFDVDFHDEDDSHVTINFHFNFDD